MEYKETIVISLGGSIIAPEGIDGDFLKNFIEIIKDYTEKGYKFGKFIKKTINSDCDDDDTDEYYNVSISYEFEFGTIIDSVYPNRIEDIHDLPNLILYQ